MIEHANDRGGPGTRRAIIAQARQLLLERLKENAAIAKRVKADRYERTQRGTRHRQADRIELDCEWGRMRTTAKVVNGLIRKFNRVADVEGVAGIKCIPEPTLRMLAGPCGALERR